MGDESVSALRDNLPGCAFIIGAIALFIAGLTVFDQTQVNEERERIARMRKVLAIVTDKGVATYENRRKGSNSATETYTETSYWIRFQCQVGGAVCEGSRLSLFPLDEKKLWETFEKGRQYEAHYDPVYNECILVIDEPPGGLARRNMKLLAACMVVAAPGFGVFLSTRR